MWKVTYKYSGGTVVETLEASNLAAALRLIASKERVRPALIKSITIEPNH